MSPVWQSQGKDHFEIPTPVCALARNDNKVIASDFMGHCNGNCEHCGGCAGELVLSQPEVEVMYDLAENAFLPVARKAGDNTPVYLEKQDQTKEQYSLILVCLEKKGLISIDFDQPLQGADMSLYADYPIQGSFALTARGQEVLDVLEKQGAKE